MLMELERHAMLMYTSCGWFFDDISGIETVQIIAYAGRVLQLASYLFGKRASGLEKNFLSRLATAKSNLPEQKDGAAVFNRYVRSMEVGLEQVAAHYAISSIFTSYPDEADIFSYSVRRLAWDTALSGRVRLAVGQALICSKITEAAETVAFGVLHFADQNITAVVKRFDPGGFRRIRPVCRRGQSRRRSRRFPGGRSLLRPPLRQPDLFPALALPRRAEAHPRDPAHRHAGRGRVEPLGHLRQSGLAAALPEPEQAASAPGAHRRRYLRHQCRPAPRARSRAGRRHPGAHLARSGEIRRSALDKQLLGYIAEQRMKNAMTRAPRAQPKSRWPGR